MRVQWISASTAMTTGGLRGRSAAVAAPPDTPRRAAAKAAVLALAAAFLVTLPLPRASAAPSNTLDVQVQSARTEPRALGGAGVHEGDPVTSYTFLINEDNTGSTAQRTPTGACSASTPGYPANCNWPSIRELPHTTAPIVAQGTEADLADLPDLPDGKYLISVLADGYKLDGTHFTVPFTTTDPVIVEVQPDPLPDATFRAQIYQDEATTNGAIDNGENGLAGFQGHLNDTLGEVTTDVYGNPLCTTYVGEHNTGPDPDYTIPAGSLDADGSPIVDVVGGKCFSDATGMLVIPHLGSNRYTATAQPPDGTDWIQTTTLEGNHDFDTWLAEGATGFDTEATVAGEPVPTPQFGFAQPKNNLDPGSGSISGVVVGVKQYTPPKGGDANFFNGLTGSKTDKPIPNPVLSLADLQNGDKAVWVGRGAADGSFTIPNVPDGDYTLSWWDEPQNYILTLVNVTVRNGEAVTMGQLPLNGWWTPLDGYVFNDTNRNGKKDLGESGISNFTLTLRKQDNSLMDRGSTTAITDATGHYSFEGAYPLAAWMVMEAYNDSFFTTGVTYQADNQKTPTTIKGAGVDVSVLNMIGLSGTMDWGVHAYNPTGSNGIDPRNGGIVGSLSYDTTRNELDPRYAAAEDWQPGVSDIPVELHAPVDCGTTSAPCDEDGYYELAPDGSYAQGTLLNTYVSEHWSRPTGCTARDVDGNPLVHKADNPGAFDEDVLAPNQETDGECISAIMQSVQYGPYATDQGTSDANFGAAVDGNYGFGDACTGTLDASDPGNPVCNGGTFQPLGSGDYLVSLDIPNDLTGHPMYNVTSEEDINIAHGDQIVPQVPPPACAGALHTVDVAGDSADPATDNYPAVVGDGTNGAPAGVTVGKSTPVDNPTFVGIGGSPYEGQLKPRCDTKLVSLNNGKSIVPMFNLFTDVPIPSRLVGLIVDDINYGTDPRSTLYGEKPGVPFAPVGIYDFNNRLVQTVESDFNGYYETLLPSSDKISCPTPSGVCTGMYRFVGNDPGVPGAVNANYNPRYRTIATEFEAMPGVTIPTDLAPTQVGSILASPTTGLNIAVSCPVDAVVPQLFAVSKPNLTSAGGAFTIEGTGFGASKGVGQVTLDGTPLPTTAWSNTTIQVTVPANTTVGAQSLMITANNGEHTVNGLTFHVTGSGYNPTVREVGPGKQYATIQGALDAAYNNNGAAGNLVVVYPGNATAGTPNTNTGGNPRGEYFENLVMASPAKLQGVGPGGFQGTTYVPGTVLNASGFAGDTTLATAWYTKVGGLTWDGNQNVSDGEAIYLLASSGSGNQAGQARNFGGSFHASVDGFDIQGGNQEGFPGNINSMNGVPTGLPANITTQGGAVFANAYVKNLQITNNVVENNGGGYGTIRIGTPDLAGSAANQHNEGVRIADNRLISNAGSNLAGAVGLFGGSDGYEVSGNDICGNFSLEYGAGVSVYGSSPGGKIHHNRIYFNNSNDEGAGIMIAGALPADPNALSPGTGAVDIDHNLVQGNLSNDDGGGIRFLMSGNYPMNVTNNTIVNNVSTHEGAGVAINDAPDVRLVNNTIMKNTTTATAVTSDGTPAPAGVATSLNSDQLQATLPTGAKPYSDPVLFNNILWDNRAGTRAGTTVTGIGLVGDATPVDHWDLGLFDSPDQLTPTNSIVQQDPAEHPYANVGNSNANPGVVSTYDTSVAFATWRQNPAFVDATLVAVEAPANLLGNYHLLAGTGPAPDCVSPACNLGAATKGTLNAPTTDIDDEVRPALGGFDAGSDEFGSAKAVTTPPPAVHEFSYSTRGYSPAGASLTPGSDIYHWNGTASSREWSAPLSLLFNNVDGLSMVDSTHFYLSFANNQSLPGLSVQDEDVVYYNNGTWSLFFDGTSRGLGGDDIDAINVVGTTLYYSTEGNTAPTGAGGPGANNDIYRWTGGPNSTRLVDASSAAYNIPNSNVDGLSLVDPTHFYLSFNDPTTNLPVLGAVQDEDIVEYDAGSWSVWFDGTANGLTTANATTAELRDIDAFSIPAPTVTPPPPPPPGPTGNGNGPLVFSTLGNANPDGVTGTGDDADLYSFDGTTTTRELDVTALPVGSRLPLSANIDAYDRVDATHFYASFADNTSVPGLGTVQDEDVVLYNNGIWTVWFDGTSRGLTSAAQDIDAISVAGNTLYFSTAGNTNPPRTIGGGTADDSDIYSVSRTATASTAPFTRVWDATANGVPSAANVDGYARVDATHFYLSFRPDTTLPGLGAVQDEDVVFNNGGTWTNYFDGTAHGLSAPGADVDAFDIP